MDDIPQGGSGGVPPGHHGGEVDAPPRPPERAAAERRAAEQGDPEHEQRVKTVRAGAPVAEQRTDREESGGTGRRLSAEG
ncbi:hypothetical protein [Kitasatospora herbaricolor]|uniref:Uncharacterized protein n=1 Tax=Kitasatospora herbaricolor TaxID=68217 RepID=A0ABZ1W237_9ACTN|nr:hypothetical protein [Kitasatospora herbaricolor]